MFEKSNILISYKYVAPYKYALFKHDLNDIITYF